MINTNEQAVDTLNASMYEQVLSLSKQQLFNLIVQMYLTGIDKTSDTLMQTLCQKYFKAEEDESSFKNIQSAVVSVLTKTQLNFRLQEDEDDNCHHLIVYKESPISDEQRKREEEWKRNAEIPTAKLEEEF